MKTYKIHETIDALSEEFNQEFTMGQQIVLQEMLAGEFNKEDCRKFIKLSNERNNV